MIETGIVTIQEISEQLNISSHSIRYFLIVLGIKPIRFIGHTGVYSKGSIEQLCSELLKRGKLMARIEQNHPIEPQIVAGAR